MSLLLLCILLVIPAFFNAGQFAILRLRSTKVQRLIEDGLPGSNSIIRLQKRLRRTLLIAELGITISLISIGWICKNFTSKWWGNNASINYFLDLVLFVTVVLLATLISGLLPKALVLNQPETSALKLSPLIEAAIKWMSPFLSLLEGLALLILKLFGLNTQSESLTTAAFSAGELEKLIETGGVTGLKPDERNILEGVFALRDTQVREVMVPRSGMVTLPREVSFTQMMEEVHKTRHARYLVIDDSLDNVLGVLDLRQLADPIAKGKMQANSSLEPYIKPVVRVLETSTLAELLPLIKNGNPLLLVVDEYGGTEGLITSADLTGEIVGDEIQFDNKESELRSLDDLKKIWLTSGEIEVIELNRELNLKLPEADDHYTLAGFVLEKLQEIPSSGETFIHNEIVFEIISMKGPRINKVKIILPK